MADKPNILFILTDQWRAATMGCMGDETVRTPNLDAMADDGVLFTNAIANCPVCTPCRAILLTGKYPLANGTLCNDLPLRTEQALLGEVFRDAGYATGYIGKWHLDGIPRTKFTPPGKRRAGFDTYWAAYDCHHDYFDTKYYLDTDELIRKEGYEPEIQTDLAIEFMTAHRDDPFFLYVSWGPPHDPYHLVPENYRAMYDPHTMPYRPNVQDVNERAYCDYYAQCTALDDQMARLLAFLRETGLENNTLVVFTSDHGDMLGSQGHQKKQKPWEESIHVPLIMRWPNRLPAGRRANLLFGLADMAPTLIAMAGIDVPTEMQGMDLSKSFFGGGPEHDSVLIGDWVPVDEAWRSGGREWRGVRTKSHTYAGFTDGDWVLYDNVNDPYQMNNLVDDPQATDIEAQLKHALHEWLKKTNDRFTTAEGHLRDLGQWEQFQERNEHFGWTKERREEFKRA
jgi:arylsulfatase A-like enzyme